MATLNTFERKNLIWILEQTGHTEYINQVDSLEAINRKMTGVWFFTDTKIIDNSKQIIKDKGKKRILNSEIDIILPNKDTFPIGLLVFIKHGIITMIEGFTYTESWPENKNLEQITFKDAYESKDSPYVLEEDK